MQKSRSYVNCLTPDHLSSRVSGLFRHVQYEADRNGFRAKVTSNEPGLSDSAGSPANVRLMLETVPAAIQEKYGLAGNGSTRDALTDSMHNETMNDDLMDEMLDSAMGGSSGIGGINEEVIRVMTEESASMNSEGENSKEPSGDLTSSGDVEASGHSAEGDMNALPVEEAINDGKESEETENSDDVLTTTKEPTEESVAGEPMSENGGNDLEMEGRTSTAARLRAARHGRRMLHRYRVKASVARRPKHYGSGAYRSLLKNSRHSRSRFGRRLTARNNYFRALKVARSQRLRKSGRTIRYARSRSGQNARKSLKRNRGALRVHRLRRRGRARRVARISGGRSSATTAGSRAPGRAPLQYGRRSRPGRRSGRRSARPQRRTSRSGRLRKPRTSKKRRGNAKEHRRLMQRSRRRRVKPVYFADRS